MFNPGHMPASLKKDVTGIKNTMGNLYVKEYNTYGNGYIDITVPSSNNTVFVYSGGNGNPFYGAVYIYPSSLKTFVNINVLDSAFSASASMPNSTTLRLTLNNYSTVYVISDFKVS